jgi:predicted dinucleotide-binding enzyme
MKLGVIGSGTVGRVLASAFIKEGYQVMLGSRNPQKEEMIKWKQENEKGHTGTFAETAAFGEAIVLSTGGAVALEAVSLAGKHHFSGKLVIDTTNPIAPGGPVNGLIPYFTELNHSLMERIQAELPEAKLVKAFNSVGSGLMYKPGFNGTMPTMFICGNDPAAKLTVTDILSSFGWETEDMGVAEAARVIEPLAILWCIPGFLRNEWNLAFKLLKK